MRTYRFPFREVLAFVDPPYQGWWSGYTPAYLLGHGASQIDVEMLRRRDSRSLPATMCTQKAAAQMATRLNELIPTDPSETVVQAPSTQEAGQ